MLYFPPVWGTIHLNLRSRKLPYFWTVIVKALLIKLIIGVVSLLFQAEVLMYMTVINMLHTEFLSQILVVSKWSTLKTKIKNPFWRFSRACTLQVLSQQKEPNLNAWVAWLLWALQQTVGQSSQGLTTAFHFFFFQGIMKHSLVFLCCLN